MRDCTIIFKPQNKKTKVAAGTDLLTAASKAGIMLDASCGGEGLCGKCKVIVMRGRIKAEPTRHITESERKKGMVLACEAVIEGDAEISVPPESLGLAEKIDKKHREVDAVSKGVVAKQESAFSHSPLIRKIYLKLPPPTLDDNISDLDRIYRELDGLEDTNFMMTKLANLKHLADILRENDFRVTVTLGHRGGVTDVLSIEAGDTTNTAYGLAFDIGTTTVTGQLLDLNKREILGTRIAYNGQIRFGSDVISRIVYASEPDGLEGLNEAVLKTLNEISDDLVMANKIEPADIYAAVFAGNTTMMHLLFKIDPAPIRREPYIPAVAAFPAISSSEMGLEMNPKALISSIPGVGAYVGGDTVAGVLSCGLYESEGLLLLVDIGTNGEIVLGNREWMMACAASAGPAFEGSGLAFGMKASKGAIQKVSIDSGYNVSVQTIGDDKPRGICGSGYIDIISQMLKRGLIEKDGKINKSIKSDRVRKGKTGCEFVISFKKDTAIAKDITIREDDIENLKRSKAAIYSAILTLLKKVDKGLTDLVKIYIAGGFGNFLNIESSVAIGLLPDIDRIKYEFIGNSSIAGARMSLFSKDAFLKAKEISKAITYLDLSSEQGYMDEYVASLFFPHTDLGRFPSVRS